MADRPSSINNAALFGLDSESLTALRAFGQSIKPTELAQTIQADFSEKLPGGNQQPLKFSRLISLLASCAEGIGNSAWETHWKETWAKLNKEGIPDLWLIALANATIDATSRLLLENGTIDDDRIAQANAMRKAILALLCSAIARDTEIGATELKTLRHLSKVTSIPDEAACIAHINRWQEDKSNTQFGLLVCTLIQRRLLAQMPLETRERLITAVGERLRQTLRAQDKIFRGELWEWIVFVPRQISATQISQAAQRFQQALSVPFIIMGREIKVSASNGAALYPEHGRDAEILIRAARIAAWTYVSDDREEQTDILIRATHFDTLPLIDARENHCAWYSHEIDQNAVSRIALSAELDQALSKGQLMLFFQPQIDLFANKVTGAEALVRWRTSQGEWISPPLIIEMIENLGKRQAFTIWLARSAARAIRAFLDAGIRINLSINLTVHDLLDENLPKLLCQALTSWQVEPGLMTLELTESVLMSNFERSIKNMQRLRQLGFCLALDDFGTGYSSLSYLHRLPIQKLKIDHSFISRIKASEADLEIVRTMVNLAHKLELSVVAEGAENVETQKHLINLGCEYVQGYLHSRPVSARGFLDWWRKFHQINATPADTPDENNENRV